MVRRSLGILQVFIGVGALFGGFGLMMDPTGVSLGMSVDFLQGTPFSNFLIPGIVLFAMNGIGTLTAALFTFRDHIYTSQLAILFGAALTLWIIAQVMFIGYQSLLQPLYFVLGALELSIGLIIRSRQGEERPQAAMV